MTLETIKSAVKTYQGSVSGTAKANQTKKPSVESVKTEAAENNKPASREVENFDAGQKGDVLDYMDSADVLNGEKNGSDNEGVRQNSRQLQDAVEKIKQNLSETEAVFGIHEGTNRVMIKIVDKATKDVLKEYPPEKTLDMIQKVWEMAGIMVDEKL